jgi:hypothetical protein
VHRPELRRHLEDILSRQVCGCVSTGGSRTVAWWQEAYCKCAG